MEVFLDLSASQNSGSCGVIQWSIVSLLCNHPIPTCSYISTWSIGSLIYYNLHIVSNRQKHAYVNLLRYTCNEYYIIIDIYQCKYYFPIIPFLM